MEIVQPFFILLIAHFAVAETISSRALTQSSTLAPTTTTSTSTSTTQPCENANSCKECPSGCSWCAGVFTVDWVPADDDTMSAAATTTSTSKPSSTMIPYGACRSSCVGVVFGDLTNAIFTVQVALALAAQSLNPKGLVPKLDYQVRALTTDERSTDWCTSAEYPPWVPTGNCDSCIKAGSENGWCKIGVNVSIKTITSSTSTTTTVPEADQVAAATDSDVASIGGRQKSIGIPDMDLPVSLSFCLPKDLQFLCNKEIIPTNLPDISNIPGFENLKISMTGIGELTLKDSSAENLRCASAPYVPNYKPKPNCSENSSCKTCDAIDQCKWCGGKLDITPKIGFMPIPIAMNVFGVCVDRSQKCDDVSIGTLAALLKNVPGDLLKFKVLEMRTKGESENLCTNVEWPPTAALSCKDCHSKDSVGWCSYSANDVSGGVCMETGMDFLCTLSLAGMTSKWNGPCPTSSTSSSTSAPRLTTDWESSASAVLPNSRVLLGFMGLVSLSTLRML